VRIQGGEVLVLARLEAVLSRGVEVPDLPVLNPCGGRGSLSWWCVRSEQEGSRGVGPFPRVEPLE